MRAMPFNAVVKRKATQPLSNKLQIHHHVDITTAVTDVVEVLQTSHYALLM